MGGKGEEKKQTNTARELWIIHIIQLFTLLHKSQTLRLLWINWF